MEKNGMVEELKDVIFVEEEMTEKNGAEVVDTLKLLMESCDAEVEVPIPTKPATPPPVMESAGVVDVANVLSELVAK